MARVLGVTQQIQVHVGNIAMKIVYLNKDQVYSDYYFQDVVRKDHVRKSVSEIEKACDKLIHAFFDGMSCIVGSNDKANYTNAKTSCNKLPNGRLSFILTKKELELIQEQMTSGLVSYMMWYIFIMSEYHVCVTFS